MLAILALRRQGAIVVDLPFGQTHKIKGGGARNLYPRALLEAARVLRPRGRFVALTPALRALTDCLESQAALWASTEAHQFVSCSRRAKSWRATQRVLWSAGDRTFLARLGARWSFDSSSRAMALSKIFASFAATS